MKNKYYKKTMKMLNFGIIIFIILITLIFIWCCLKINKED